MSNTITPVDVARVAGLSPNTARRYLKEGFKAPLRGERLLIPADQLDRAVAFCQSKQQRKRRNANNSVLLEGIAG